VLGSYHTGLIKPPFKQGPIVGAVAGMFANSYIAGSLGTLVAGNIWNTAIVKGITYATMAGAIGGAIVSAVVSGALAETPDQPDFGTDGASRGILLNKAANDAQIPVVYGQRKVGGTRVFMEVTGSDNEYLHMVLAISEGEIDSIENIYLTNVLSTDSRFSGFLDTYTHTGADDQAADTNLVNAVSEWSSNHRLRGTTYLYARLKYDQDAFASGLPTITADVKGVKVYDPRTTTTAWSDNPALCIRDYLTNTRYGRGIDTSLIDDTSFNAAANYCEEQVTIGGTTKDRYTLNGVVDTSQGSMDVLKKLLTSCRGFLVFSGGKYKLIIDKPETAAFTFSEDNIVGAWSIKLGDKNSQFNRIRGNFFNPEREWQPDIAVVDSPTLRTQDNGLLLEKTIDLPFTSDIDRAKMISTINLNQSRQQIMVEFTSTIEGLKTEVGDVVYISHATPGWASLNSGSGKLFRVMRVTIQNTDEIRILALEYDATAYDFGTIQVSDGAPNTNLPDATQVGSPTALSVSEELYVTATGKGAQVRANLSWGQPTDAFVTAYDVEYKNGTGSWEFVTTTKALSARVNDLSAGEYYFRVRSINTMGVRSNWTETSKIIFAGLTTPPAIITNFSVRAIDGSCHLQWDRVTDIDVLHGGYIRIRHTPMISGVTWAHGTDIGEALAGTATNVVLPLLAGTYMAKAVDSAGNFSTDDIQAFTTVPNIMSFNVVSTLTEHPNFTGQKEDTTTSGSVLRLDGAPNPIILEDGFQLLTEAGETIETEVAQSAVVDAYGEYYFANDLDLGDVYTSRVSANIVASGYVVSDVVDNRADNIDTWANFDGEPSDAVSAQLQIRTTADNPAASPTWTTWNPLVVGDYHARAYEFRVIFNSTNSSRNIDVSTLEVTVDMPDRNERAQNLTVPVGGSSITYANAFKDVPSLGITAQNADGNDWFSLTNETSTGFDIEFFNGNNSIERSMNYMATGYGKAV